MAVCFGCHQSGRLGFHVFFTPLFSCCHRGRPLHRTRVESYSRGSPDTRCIVDPLFAPRQLGNPNAKVVVEEWFSLTCIHCAHFAENTFPQVKTNLIDTGKIRYVFHDFPTDQTATIAAMVARALPVDRYEPSAPRCCPASTAGPMTAKPTR